MTEESAIINACIQQTESTNCDTCDNKTESTVCNICNVQAESTNCDKCDKQMDYPYGWCTYCEEFIICSKEDKVHRNALLYNEDCREHHYGGFSVCIPCALKAFTKNENFIAGEEQHCICPVCSYDFGLLRDLLYA